MRVGRQFPLLDGVVPDGKPIFDCVRGVRYRYNLPRSVLGRADRPRAVFVCMNPSSADEWHDDWTNRLIAKRALEMEWRGSRLGRWNTVNLCGAIATDPEDLLRLNDPVGPDNLAEIDRAAGEADLVVAAWGNGGAPWAYGRRITVTLVAFSPRSGSSPARPARPRRATGRALRRRSPSGPSLGLSKPKDSRLVVPCCEGYPRLSSWSSARTSAASNSAVVRSYARSSRVSASSRVFGLRWRRSGSSRLITFV